MPLWKKIALSVLSVIIALAVLEIVCTVSGLEARYHEPRKYSLFIDPAFDSCSPYNFYPKSTVRITYDSDPRNYFDPGFSIDHHHNLTGWRGRDHSIRKPVGTYRILGLGDSFLWGNGVREEDVCLAKLEKLLQKGREQPRIETVNAAMIYYNTVNQKELLEYRGLDYDPDCVMVYFALDDVKEEEDMKNPPLEYYRHYAIADNSKDVLSNYSSLWGWVRQRYLFTSQARSHIKTFNGYYREDSVRWKRCRQALIDMKTMCRDRNITMMVVIFPYFYSLDKNYPFTAIHDTIRQHCESNGILVLDLLPAYKSFKGPELWVHPIDQHPNEIAHGIAAETVADYVNRHAADLFP